MVGTSETPTVVGPGARFKGELTINGGGNILGDFEGAITGTGVLHVAHGANVLASIEADTVLIDGAVEGNITARDRVELGSKARLVGDVNAGALAVAVGASFSGRVNVV